MSDSDMRDGSRISLRSSGLRLPRLLKFSNPVDGAGVRKLPTPNAFMRREQKKFDAPNFLCA